DRSREAGGASQAGGHGGQAGVRGPCAARARIVAAQTTRIARVEPRGSRTLQAPITSKFDTELHPTGVLVKPPRGRTALGSVVLLHPLRVMGKICLRGRLG